MRKNAACGVGTRRKLGDVARSRSSAPTALASLPEERRLQTFNGSSSSADKDDPQDKAGPSGLGGQCPTPLSLPEDTRSTASRRALLPIPTSMLLQAPCSPVYPTPVSTYAPAPLTTTTITSAVQPGHTILVATQSRAQGTLKRAVARTAMGKKTQGTLTNVNTISRDLVGASA